MKTDSPLALPLPPGRLRAGHALHQARDRAQRDGRRSAEPLAARTSPRAPRPRRPPSLRRRFALASRRRRRPPAAQSPAAPRRHRHRPHPLPTTKVSPDPHSGHDHQATTKTSSRAAPPGRARRPAERHRPDAGVVPPTPTPWSDPAFQPTRTPSRARTVAVPMKIHGKRGRERAAPIPVYGTGSKQVDSLKFELLAKQELARRVAAGEEPQYAGSPTRTRPRLDRQRKDFLLSTPRRLPDRSGRGFLSRTCTATSCAARWPATSGCSRGSQGTGRRSRPRRSSARAAARVVGTRSRVRRTQENDGRAGAGRAPQDDPIFVDSLRRGCSRS